jgi:hypothetical protein
LAAKLAERAKRFGEITTEDAKEAGQSFRKHKFKKNRGRPDGQNSGGNN